MASHDDKADLLTAEVPEMVTVIAPADLPDGYRFEAQVLGDPQRLVNVVVPEGGVKEGQRFQVSRDKSVKTPDRQRLRAPRGHWKDGLFQCCNYGCCHPSLWCAICCPYILMAQVMTRMRLTWIGEQSRSKHAKKTFRCIFGLVVFYVSLLLSLEVAEYYLFDFLPISYRRQFRLYIPVIKTTAFIFFTLWGLYALCMTRESVRIRYSIRQKSYFCGCEDLWCSMCCTCCTVAQLARHTGEYEKYPASCFGASGHASEVPQVV